MKRTVFLIFVYSISISLFGQTTPKTKILVLGTPHLEQLQGFQPAFLKRVLDTLKTKKFDAVAVENMPAELILDIKGRTERHWQDLYSIVGKPVEVGLAHQKTMNLSFTAAREVVKKLRLKDSDSDKDRLDYINSYLCTYDIWSALLYYNELRDKNKLDKSVRDFMEEKEKSNNEINTIGVTTAKYYRLKQVDYIDNLQDETILINDFPLFMEEYQANSKLINELVSKSKLFEKTALIEKEAIKSQDLYHLYKFYNSGEYMNLDYETQWSLWFKTNFSSKADRSRYSLWEQRNLFITANILRVVASHPGKAILVIIGASHKSFLEKYLKQIPDIELLVF